MSGRALTPSEHDEAERDRMGGTRESFLHTRIKYRGVIEVYIGERERG